MSNKNGEHSPEWQKLYDRDGGKNFVKYSNDFAVETQNVKANPDNLIEEDGYTLKMRRGPRELMAFKILDRAVRSLSKAQRDAYKLVYKDGFTLAAAGMLLGGISPQGVKKNLDGAMRNIAKFCRLHESELDNVG
jgi:hypothetical protein